jgi:hypothetical protein
MTNNQRVTLKKKPLLVKPGIFIFADKVCCNYNTAILFKIHKPSILTTKLLPVLRRKTISHYSKTCSVLVIVFFLYIFRYHMLLTLNTLTSMAVISHYRIAEFSALLPVSVFMPYFIFIFYCPGYILKNRYECPDHCIVHIISLLLFSYMKLALSSISGCLWCP